MRPRVLIADDYPEMVKAVSRLLAFDCEVVGNVADGGALEDAVQRLRPDVIVLDLSLPNLHALDACREIARVHPETRVILFTALNDPTISESFLAAGASAFVSKLASADLLPAIMRLCGGRGSKAW